MVKEGAPAVQAIRLFTAGIALIFFCAMSGCSLRDAHTLPHSSSRIIRNITFYPQDDYQCGPASLASIMDFLGVNTSPEDIARDIYSLSARGTLNIDMVAYPQKKGLKAYQYSGSIENIKNNIDSGNPLIVFVDLGVLFLQANHFMVIIGYNENGVIANSGREGHKFIPYEDFIETWEKTKYWTLLIKKQ